MIFQTNRSWTTLIRDYTQGQTTLVSKYQNGFSAFMILSAMFIYAFVVVIVVVVYFILSRLLYLAFSANLGLLCMPHPGMGPLV